MALPGSDFGMAGVSAAHLKSSFDTGLLCSRLASLRSSVDMRS